MLQKINLYLNLGSIILIMANLFIGGYYCSTYSGSFECLIPVLFLVMIFPQIVIFIVSRTWPNKVILTISIILTSYLLYLGVSTSWFSFFAAKEVLSKIF